MGGRPPARDGFTAGVSFTTLCHHPLLGLLPLLLLLLFLLFLLLLRLGPVPRAPAPPLSATSRQARTGRARAFCFFCFFGSERDHFFMIGAESSRSALPGESRGSHPEPARWGASAPRILPPAPSSSSPLRAGGSLRPCPSAQPKLDLAPWRSWPKLLTRGDRPPKGAALSQAVGFGRPNIMRCLTTILVQNQQRPLLCWAGYSFTSRVDDVRSDPDSGRED